MSFSLEATTRAEVGRKTNALRSESAIPAVVYGNFTKPQSIKLDYNTFIKLYRDAGESSIIDLAIDGKDSIPVLIHEFQQDALTEEVIHIDFRTVDMNKELEAVVTLKFVGESAAVKALGGTLIRSRESVNIRCLPANLLRNITVDLTKLATFEDSIRIGDLELPEGVQITDASKLAVAVVSKPRTSAEIEALDEEVSGDVADVEGAEESKEGEAEAGGEAKSE
ncbi:50S ribosomal protein L25 [Candidatus Uhrbacteria bacterium]|jgi:large subunit ribosomal protein L25|nr:50S ribosomal protein L25 [Candidatus Uhrbacteria bacterium]